MTDHAKTIFDASSIAVVAGTLMNWLPSAAAAASLIWSVIRIYETRNRAEVDQKMSQAIVISYGEVILLGVVVAGLLFAAFRK